VLDRDGVGKLIKMAVEKGRGVNPKLKVGICGEHGGEPSSIEFCHLTGLNYVSCSPFRVPIARLAAAQAALKNASPAKKVVAKAAGKVFAKAKDMIKNAKAVKKAVTAAVKTASAKPAAKKAAVKKAAAKKPAAKKAAPKKAAAKKPAIKKAAPKKPAKKK
jgi:pyruvate,orthophosphate dikinase